MYYSYVKQKASGKCEGQKTADGVDLKIKV
jgi:hypothetical protein